jgi:tetratricopeptide (TPR) repeat protein
LSGKAIDRLASLEKNNLILPIETLDGEIHFTMLETIREYSRERLAKRADATDTHLKHATYYTELAERANRQIRSELNKYWFKRLRAENQNFRVALAWSLEGEESEYGLRIVGALLYHWYYNGLGSENRLFLDLALELSKKSTPTLRAGVLLTSAFLAYARGDLKTSHEQLEEALLLYQELGDEIKQGHALMHFSVSTIVGESPALNKELKLAHQALEIFRAHGDTANMAQAYNVLGELERTMRNYDAAKKHYKKALALSRESGETLREAILHINLAFIAFHEEDFVEANRLNKLGLGLFVELASFFGMASHLASFAGPIVALGYPKRAARLLGAANAHLELIGSYQQPADQPEIELFLKNAQEALTKDAFQTAWEEGQRMTIQEAVAYALSDEEVE